MRRSPSPPTSTPSLSSSAPYFPPLPLLLLLLLCPALYLISSLRSSAPSLSAHVAASRVVRRESGARSSVAARLLTRRGTLAPGCWGQANGWLEVVREDVATQAVFAVAVLLWLHYSASVSRQIASFLGISIFKVGAPTRKDTRTARARTD